jgi:hypothetical protein
MILDRRATMAITNLPYDDGLILDGITSVPVITKETRDVQVDFAGTSVEADGVATVTATVTWTISAPDAVRILNAARPTESAA